MEANVDNEEENTSKERFISFLSQSCNKCAWTKYFKMLKIGLPLKSVKHALIRDGLYPSVLDGDHNKPADYQDSTSEIALKDNSAYAKYFKMIKWVCQLVQYKMQLNVMG